MEGEVWHIYIDYDENEESDDETNGEDNGVAEVAQTKSHARERLQRRRQVYRRLEDCEIWLDSAVNNEGYLIHFAFLADVEGSYERVIEVN